MFGRRTAFHIIRDILVAGRGNQAQLISELGLNWKVVSEYLQFLQANGFLHIYRDSSSVLFQVTPEGFRLLKKLDEVLSMLGLVEPRALSPRLQSARSRAGSHAFHQDHD